MKTFRDFPDEQIIDPIPFKPAASRRPAGFLPWSRWLFIALLVCLLFPVLYALLFVFTARQVSIQINPEPDRISIKGSLFSIHLGSTYLLRPGSYRVNAFKSGYAPLELPLLVTDGSNQKLIAAMQMLPGRLTVTAHPEGQPSGSIAGAAVYLDGEEAGLTPLTGIEVKPGLREVLIKADEYRDFKTSIEVEGMGVLQTIHAALASGWTEISIDSIPAGAEVTLDGNERGNTPLQLRLAAGTYHLEISAPHYKRWQSHLEVKDGERQIFDPVTLQPADGIVTVRTTPSGASVSVDGAFHGQTPVSISLPPDTDHAVHVSKAGYEQAERRVRVASEAVQVLNLTLKARTGIIYFKVTPGNAELVINGTSHRPVPESLTLNAVPQKIRISKEGYASYQTEITPQPGIPRELTIVLQKTASTTAGTTPLIKARNGYALTLVRPASFTMGSSRQEQGRRSNETLREIVLARPFYMGLAEVSNREFRTFLPSHDSGYMQDYSLNRDAQPVVNITWEQAARFCNWLSEMEKLPPAYVEEGGVILSPTPLTSGYRLPTEAEWEYCARFTPDREAALLYPWGNTFPPANKTVNIADLSARNLLPVYFDNYEDGYPVSGPPASFPAGAFGIYDLGGNVAEWCHDYYSIYPYNPGQHYQDPAGAQEGKHHLVRGSSWKHASISPLRSAYRDYCGDRRLDLGFRVCRYVD